MNRSPMEPKKIQLNLPARLESGTTRCSTDPKEISSWITTLPLADAMESARILYNSLVELNRTALPVTTRLQILEILRPTVQSAAINLGRFFHTKSFPPSAKAQSTADLARELYAELATGYKITLYEGSNAPIVDKKSHTTAIHRAITYLCAVLVHAYEVYAAPSPAGYWKEIHEIYHYAEESGYAQIQVADSVNKQNQLMTIGSLYNRMLLLALASPYRLRFGEVTTLYEQLEDWAGMATLSHIDSLAANAKGFVVNLNSDEPPAHTQSELNGPLSQYRLLDTENLSIALREAIKNASDHPAGRGKLLDDLLTKDLLRRVFSAWNENPKRKFSRVLKTASVLITAGLKSVFDTLAAGQQEPVQVEFDQGPRFESPVQDTRPVYWEMTEIPLEWAAASANGLENNEPNNRRSDALLSNEWDIVNVSAGGFCLLWSRADVSKVQVGEILCIKEEENPSRWAIACVRWMRCNRRHGMEIGISMLAPEAIAVAVRHVNHPNYFRALLIPELKSIGQPAALLVAIEECKVGDHVMVKREHQEVKLLLTKTIENSGSYAQFQISSGS